MSVIDLEAEREARAPLQSEVLQKSIAVLDRQIALLVQNDDAESALMLAKLSKEKATVVRKLVSAQQAEAKAAAKAAQQSIPDHVLDDEVKGQIREWLKSNDYYYTHQDGSYWLYTPGARQPWTAHARSSLVNHDPRLESRSPYFDCFTEVLQEDGKWFRDHTRTFAKVGPNTLNMLRWSFLQPVADEHHWVFDALLHSLAGGKVENIEHLERVIAAKWSHPENYLLPTIVISDEGGTGKSLFAEKVLPAIFGKDMVAPNVSMDEITGQFNGHLQGKAVWFVNENRADQNDQDAIKRVLGSPTLRSERKGKDATLTDNTALMIVAGNFTLGAIKLAGTEVDRRFSILKNNNPLKVYTSELLSVLEERVVTQAEAHTWMETTGQHILSDTAEVAKWLNSILTKHGKLSSVIALHGEDYATMLDGQISTHDQVFRAFFNSDAWLKTDGFFKAKTMFDFYLDYAKRAGFRPMSNQRFYAECEAYAKRKGISYQRIAASKWDTGIMGLSNITTASIWWNPKFGMKPNTLMSNDDEFFSTDENKRVTWKVEID